ncbi:MAG TPA: ABC transporter permease, partial [Bacillota bacterium]|nr:ABC transporter permease [Bacillota bacterium]
MGQASLRRDELYQGALTRSADIPALSPADRAGRARTGLWSRLMSHRGGRLGLIIVLAYVAVAVAAPVLAPHPPGAVDLMGRLAPPAVGTGNLLGTDQLGRDILSRIMHGARVSMLVGLATVSISAALGVGLGMVAGYCGGVLDRTLARLAELLLAFPYLIFVIGAMSIMGPGFANLVWALSLKGWVEFYRLSRALVMSEKNREYVEAARVLGRSDSAICVREILPNIANSILVLGTLRMGNMIVMESSLSFLGLGIPPRMPAWDSMINDGRRYMLTSPWVATFPG